MPRGKIFASCRFPFLFRAFCVPSYVRYRTDHVQFGSYFINGCLNIRLGKPSDPQTIRRDVMEGVLVVVVLVLLIIFLAHRV